VVEALAIDRSSDLFGADGPHRACVLIEPQTRRLEVEPTIVQKSPHLGLYGLDQILIDDPVHPTGQHLIYVRHQRHIVRIVSPKIGQIVGEALPLREMLLEGGEAGRHRMTPRVDDLRPRQDQVQKSYVDENVQRGALAAQVRELMAMNKQLSDEAQNLTSALKGSNKTQGNWGEMILARVLENSGLRKGHEYDVQQSHTLEDGSRLQPDVVIHLPEDRHLVVDAKVSLTAYEKYALATEDKDREATAKLHLDSVRAHIKGLSPKNYQDLYQLKSLDFVLMFIPIEPAFMLAVTHDSDLFMDAWEKNVLLVSPSTLLFVVRTVAHLWRQQEQSANAQEIAKQGAVLYDKFTAFAADLEKIGERIKQTQASYDSAHTKLTGRGSLVYQAQKLQQLGVKPTKSMPAGLLQETDHNSLE